MPRKRFSAFDDFPVEENAAEDKTPRDSSRPAESLQISRQRAEKPDSAFILNQPKVPKVERIERLRTVEDECPERLRPLGDDFRVWRARLCRWRRCLLCGH